MIRIISLSLLLAAHYVAAGVHDNQVNSDFPIISSTYITSGTLYIPYAEIEEPFNAWVDEDKGRSRIDFYGGDQEGVMAVAAGGYRYYADAVESYITTKPYTFGGTAWASERVAKTYQLASVNGNGVMRKIVPMSTDKVMNQLTCFEVNGTAISPIGPQSVLPDVTNFSYVGMEMVNGVNTKKYQLVVKDFQKVNKYTYWVQAKRSKLYPTLETGIPIRYEMRGYNSLLGSHYDHYYLDYDTFSVETPSDEVFEVPSDLQCGDFPGPGADHHRTIATFNPMKEFVHHYDEHIANEFRNFVSAHNKQYKHETEHQERINVFRHNFRYIQSKNRQGLTFKLAVNHLADRTPDELKVLRGRRYTKGYNGGQPFDEYTKKDVEDLPESYDWRLYGAVTPVKDQSVCGSCWSFGTIGAVEGAHFLKTGELVRLSQQALIDCSWGYGNNGCDGGEDFRSYQYIMDHGGIPSSDEYGPYLGIDGYCHAQNTSKTAKITGYVNVTSGDEDALKLAIVKKGPISVAIDASHKSLSFYANGVYYEKECGNKEDQLDHAVLAVGYGTLGKEPFWLVKNSWSTYWGNDGYVLMSRRDNNCGVATTPTYVTM